MTRSLVVLRRWVPVLAGALCGLLLSLPLAAPPLAAQTPVPAAPPPAASAAPVRVYLDCQNAYCDLDHLRREVAWVAYVRDRADADVHVLITQRTTGAGGTEYTLAFLGQGRFAGAEQALRAVAPPDASLDALREALLGPLRLGLVRYAAESGAAGRLRVQYDAPADGEAAAPERDPWNAWSFRLGASGFFNGEQRSSSRFVSASVAANRVTERWKVRLRVRASEDRSEFELDSVTTIVSVSQDRAADALVVRSLGARLSAGGRLSGATSSYLNQDGVARAQAALEYNLFPYAESTRRQLSLLYLVGPEWYDYEEETIFGKTAERVVRHSLTASLVMRQPWGSAGVDATAAQYLEHPDRNRLTVGGSVELNVFRGLSLSVSGSYARIRDLISLPAGEATEEEVLLRLRQLDTGYSYYLSLGVGYTFGSRLSPVVNPRLSGVDWF